VSQSKRLLRTKLIGDTQGSIHSTTMIEPLMRWKALR
jgi:hypothetical protein